MRDPVGDIDLVGIVDGNAPGIVKLKLMLNHMKRKVVFRSALVLYHLVVLMLKLKRKRSRRRSELKEK